MSTTIEICLKNLWEQLLMLLDFCMYSFVFSKKCIDRHRYDICMGHVRALFIIQKYSAHRCLFFTCTESTSSMIVGLQVRWEGAEENDCGPQWIEIYASTFAPIGVLLGTSHPLFGFFGIQEHSHQWSFCRHYSICHFFLLCTYTRWIPNGLWRPGNSQSLSY